MKAFETLPLRGQNGTAEVSTEPLEEKLCQDLLDATIRNRLIKLGVAGFSKHISEVRDKLLYERDYDALTYQYDALLDAVMWRLQDGSLTDDIDGICRGLGLIGAKTEEEELHKFCVRVGEIHNYCIPVKARTEDEAKNYVNKNLLHRIGELFVFEETGCTQIADAYNNDDDDNPFDDGAYYIANNRKEN